MKQPERVAELLAELRALSENDFERHRIDVLERDLTAPPAVEIIDDKHQRFNGVTYLKNNKSGHFSRHIGIHRAVWAYYNGELPEGDFNIHHRDLNPDNNAPDNLQLLTQADHRRLHNALLKIEKICPVCGKIFHNSDKKVQCCSLSCGVKLRSANHAASTPTKERICPTCGGKFIAEYSKKIYCSRACYIAKAK